MPDLALLLFCAFVLSLGAIIYLRSEFDQSNVSHSQVSGLSAKADLDINSYSLLIDAMQFPAYILDDKGSVIYANKASHAAFGVIKNSDKIFIRFRQPELRQLIENALQENTSMTGEYNEPIPDDRWFAVEIAPIPEKDKRNLKQHHFLAFHEKAIDRFTDVMLDQANRMTRLVNDLLSLSRIEMQSHVKPSKVINLNEVVASVIDSLESVAKRLNVAIEFNSLGAVNILGDRDELLQVFENGIALEHQHRITERFYRVDVARSREKQGTGLGLAIVKHILNRHSTKLGIDSMPESGARFFVNFPVLNELDD